MEIDRRKRQVLYAIVHDYIQTAEPVGSRTIARRYNLGVSPATIRNEMSDLEDLGYLEQPHTSAGRIPSDLGYRFYVDSLLRVPELTAQEAEFTKRILSSRLRDSELVVQQIAKLLSALTNYTSIVLGPSQGQATLRQLQLVPLADGRMLLVGVTNGGFLINRVIENVPGDINNQHVLGRIQNWLNHKLGGVELERIRAIDMRELQSDMEIGIGLFEQLMDDVIDSLRQREQERIYLGGATNILNQPEFRDFDRVKALLELFDEEAVMWDVVMQAPAGGISVSIGAENALSAMRTCSLITAEYQLGGGLSGRIGILGPTRMEYARVMALVQHVCDTLQHLFER